MGKFKEMLLNNPVIASIRNNNEMGKVIDSSSNIVFVLYGDILSIGDTCSTLRKKGKIVFIHVDLIDGLKGDSAGIKFIKEHVNPDGIISTKTSSIRYANQLGLYTIQRIFVIDSLSLQTGIKSIHETKPNAVEVMPGIASKIISSLEKEVNAYIIAGGLIQDKKDIMDSLAAGAMAISTTHEELWNM